MPIGAQSYESDEVSGEDYRALLDASVVLADLYFDELSRISRNQDIEDSVFADDLPRTFLPRYTVGFVRRYFACFLTVAWKLRAPGVHRLACVAEELALSAMVRFAEGLPAADGSIAERNFSGFEAIAFEDLDFERLFESRLVDLEGSAAEGLANLRFKDWFEPFRDEDPVHPYVEDAPETGRRRSEDGPGAESHP